MPSVSTRRSSTGPRARRARVLAVSIAAAAATAAAAAFFVRPLCLCFADRAGRDAARFVLGREGSFTLSHRHSVAKLPWVDRFRAGPGGVMVLEGTRYGAFGAGLPSGDEGGTVRLEGGWIVIEGMDRRFARVVIAPGPATEHRLGIGGRAWALWPLAEGRGPLAMELRREPLARLAVSAIVGAGRRLRAAAAAGPDPEIGVPAAEEGRD